MSASGSLAVVALFASACVEVEGADITIDLAARTVTIVLHGLRSPPETAEADFESLEKGAKEAGLLGSWPKLELLHDSLEATGERLDIHIEARFAAAEDFGIRPWTTSHPARWCPPHGFVVTDANAAARDRSGCVLWRAGSTVLRIRATNLVPPRYPSLLPFFRATQKP